jgi:hypothetical protein
LILLGITGEGKENKKFLKLNAHEGGHYAADDSL